MKFFNRNYYLTNLAEVNYLVGHLLIQAGNNQNAANNANTLRVNATNAINVNGEYLLATRYHTYFRNGQYSRAFQNARNNPGQIF